jgi:hypothetical protein
MDSRGLMEAFIPGALLLDAKANVSIHGASNMELPRHPEPREKRRNSGETVSMAWIIKALSPLYSTYCIRTPWYCDSMVCMYEEEGHSLHMKLHLPWSDRVWSGLV